MSAQGHTDSYSGGQQHNYPDGCKHGSAVAPPV